MLTQMILEAWTMLMHITLEDGTMLMQMTLEDWAMLTQETKLSSLNYSISWYNIVPDFF